ncbi:hypothetical protein OAO87_02725 [bacterium]|nr:hypothetical protein [bacterium]
MAMRRDFHERSRVQRERSRAVAEESIFMNGDDLRGDGATALRCATQEENVIGEQRYGVTIMASTVASVFLRSRAARFSRKAF